MMQGWANIPISRSRTARTSLFFVALALVCLDLMRFFWGVMTPDFFSSAGLATALLRTLAFAFVGVTLGAGAGFLLALVYRFRMVRTFCAFIRAIHELFWALIFLQFFGFHPLTGVLAIAIPYAGIFAKVYSEILDEADQEPRNLLPSGVGALSAFVYTRIPDCWEQLRTYTSYRLECGFRSSAICRPAYPWLLPGIGVLPGTLLRSRGGADSVLCTDCYYPVMGAATYAAILYCGGALLPG